MKSSVIRKPVDSNLSNNTNNIPNRRRLAKLLESDANLRNLRINKRKVEEEAATLSKSDPWISGGSRWPTSAEKICKKTDDVSWNSQWKDLSLSLPDVEISVFNSVLVRGCEHPSNQ